MGSAPIDKAIEYFGTQVALARACGVSQQALNKAYQRGSVSAELAVAIHHATGGTVTAASLRPDLWPLKPNGFKPTKRKRDQAAGNQPKRRQN